MKGDDLNRLAARERDERQRELVATLQRYDTLLQRFASAALQGLLASPAPIGDHVDARDIALQAYDYAEAMIAVHEERIAHLRHITSIQRTMLDDSKKATSPNTPQERAAPRAGEAEAGSPRNGSGSR